MSDEQRSTSLLISMNQWWTTLDQELKAVLFGVCLLIPVVPALLALVLNVEPPIRAALLTVAGTIVTAEVALIGFFLTLSWNRTKHLEDAEFALRREVFLEAAKTFPAVLSFIGRLPFPVGRVGESHQVVDAFAGIVGRINIVAGEPTREAVLNFQIAVMRFYLKMIGFVRELEANDGTIALKEKELETVREDSDVFAGDKDCSASGLTRTISEFRHRRRVLERQAAIDARKEMIVCAHLATSAMVEFRRDLRQSLEERWFQKQTEKMLALIKELSDEVS